MVLKLRIPALFVACLPQLLYAQSGTLPQDRPADHRPELPEARPEPAAPLQIPERIGPKPDSAPKGRLAVFVRSIAIEGNSAIGDEELAPIVEPFENRRLDSDDLETLRLALTRYYVERGYLNSGAWLPDQDLAGGVVRIRITEGRVTRIGLQGTEALRPEYVSERLALGIGPPVNIERLRERIQLLHQDPRIKRLDAQLRPGLRRGEADLLVRIEEAPMRYARIQVDNHNPPSVGSGRFGLELGHLSLTGRGDELIAGFNFSEGSVEGSLGYQLPVNARGSRLGARFNYRDSEVIEEPFNVLELQSESQTFGLDFRHPLVSELNREWVIGAMLEHKTSRSKLLGQPSFLTPAAEDGRVRITALRLFVEWFQRRPNQVLVLRSTLSRGLDALDATVSSQGFPDGRFTALLLQGQWLRRFEQGGELLLRSDIQIADQGLLPEEQIAVGGAYTVRGYRENRLVTDQAAIVSGEYRFSPLRQTLLPGQVRPAVFTDFGLAENREGSNPDPDHLASIGAGLRWRHGREAGGEIFYGHALTGRGSRGDNLQDDGLHIRLFNRFH